MKLLLTSSTGGSYKDENGVRIPCEMDRSNGFVNQLQSMWPAVADCLIISSDPDNHMMNDSLRSQFPESFWMSGMPVQNMEVLDSRNADETKQLIHDSNVIILSGGHVPTQNRFFHQIQLKEALQNYAGIIIGISAGTMNCAETVYAQPEEEGEAINPNYEKYLSGLGFTGIRVLPHFQFIRELTLDGKRILEDICIPDSYVRSFYALVDGSYLYIDEGGETTLYGEAYLFENGRCERICEIGKTLKLV